MASGERPRCTFPVDQHSAPAALDSMSLVLRDVVANVVDEIQPCIRIKYAPESFAKEVKDALPVGPRKVCCSGHCSSRLSSLGIARLTVTSIDHPLGATA